MTGSTRQIARFLILFGIFFVLGHLLLGTAWGERIVLHPWVEGNIRTSLLFAAPLGIHGQVDGDTIATAAGASVEVGKGCDGLGALLVVTSAILGFPAGWKSRVIGLALGTVAVFLINAVRIASLVWIAVHWPARLQFFHIDIWQPVMMVVSFGLFLLWGTLIAGGSRKKTAGEST